MGEIWRGVPAYEQADAVGLACRLRPGAEAEGFDDLDGVAAMYALNFIVQSVPIDHALAAMIAWQRRCDTRDMMQRRTSTLARVVRNAALALLWAATSTAGVVDLASAQASVPARRVGSAVFYRYHTPDGRTVYTNMVEQVPAEQRESGRLDLLHVAQRKQLAQQLDASLKVEHEKLLDSECCKQLRQEARRPVGRRVWPDQAPLMICGAALFLFILLTPWMAGKVGTGPWARALSMATSSLVLAGIMMFATMRATRVVHEFVTRAAPCQPDAWNAALAGSKLPVVTTPPAPTAAPPAAQLLESSLLPTAAARAPAAAAPAAPDMNTQLADVLHALEHPPAAGDGSAAPGQPHADDEGAIQELQQHVQMMQKLQQEMEQFQHSGAGSSTQANPGL